MNISGEAAGEKPHPSREPIEVVHAFGTCPRNVRGNICLLDSKRVVYSVGSRVAFTHSDGNASKLGFLSTGLRASEVHAISCSVNKRFIAVCYNTLDNPGTAYTTVYHMPTKPRPSRVKTLSYRRGKKRAHAHEKQESFERNIADGRATPSHSVDKYPLDSAHFVNANFSHDCRLLMVLDGHPEWTLLGFEWRIGWRQFSVCIGSPVYRTTFSPLDSSKMATAGANGHFRIWRIHAGKAVAMNAIAGIPEDACFRDLSWLNSDRLALVTSRGEILLVSPSDVLQEWDLRQKISVGNDGGKNSQGTADSGRYPRSKCERGVALAGLLDENEGLHAVLCHQRGFFVGSSKGRVLVFEQGQGAACATAAATITAAGTTNATARGNGWVPDAFSLTRVVQVCAADVVELQPGESTNPPWVRGIYK